MKKIIAFIGIIGWLFILGSAGLADTFSGEMLKTLIIGILLIVVSVVSYVYYNSYVNSIVFKKRIEKLRAGV